MPIAPRHARTVSESMTSQNQTRPPPTGAPLTGEDAFVAHRLAQMMAPTNGRAHDADGGVSGLTTGNLSNPATPVGGYRQLSAGEAETHRQRLMKEYSQLRDADRQTWDQKAASQNAAAGAQDQEDEFGETPAGDFIRPVKPVAASGDDSQPRGNAVYDPEKNRARGFPGRSSPRPISIAGAPADVGRALRDAQGISPQALPTTQSRPLVGTGPQIMGLRAQNVADEASRAAYLQPPHYGKLGQVASPQDVTSTDAAGNRTISTAGGGTVSIPASQPQTPPDESFAASNGTATGIYQHGVEQVKQPDGTFAPGRSSLAIGAGQAAPASNDPLSIAAGSSGVQDSLTAGLMKPPASSSSPSAFPGGYAKPPMFDDDEEQGTTRAFPGLASPPPLFRRRIPAT